MRVLHFLWRILAVGIILLLLTSILFEEVLPRLPPRMLLSISEKVNWLRNAYFMEILETTNQQDIERFRTLFPEMSARARTLTLYAIARRQLRQHYGIISDALDESRGDVSSFYIALRVILSHRLTELIPMLESVAKKNPYAEGNRVESVISELRKHCN